MPSDEHVLWIEVRIKDPSKILDQIQVQETAVSVKNLSGRSMILLQDTASILRGIKSKLIEKGVLSE